MREIFAIVKKTTKITLWVLGVLFGLGVLVVTSADVAVSRIAEKQARAAIEAAQLPYTIEFDHIHVLLMSGCVELEDIHFGASGKALKNNQIDTVDIKVPNVAFRMISYKDLIKHRKLSVNSLKVRKACAKMKGKSTKLSVEADSLTVELRHLYYCLADSTYGYCDSLYDVSLSRLQFTNARGLIKIEANDLKTEDGGPIFLGNTRIWNSVAKRELANILKEPSTWIDLKLNSVEVSPLNLLRTDFTKGLTLDKITVKAKHLDVFRDNRLKPTKPFPMPQTVIAGMSYPLRIKRVEFMMPKLDVGVLMTDKNLGQLQVTNIQMVARDFSTKRGNVLKANLTAELGTGKFDGVFRLHNDKECNFDLDLQGREVETSCLTGMLRPIVAMELDCHVDSLKAKYSGNSENITGTVMLAYHGMKGRVFKGEDIPIRIVQQNAGAIEYFVNHLIPKSNPRNDSKAPLEFNVDVKRDEMKPFPLYALTPLIMGAVETFLPGLFQGKKVKKTKE